MQIVSFTSCSTPFFDTDSLFDLTCYGPTNFSNLTSPSNFTLYGCPLTCFSSNTIDIEQVTTAPPVYVSLMTNSSNITYYYLVSNLFPNYIVQCIGPRSTLTNNVNAVITSVPPTLTLSSSSTFINTIYNFQSSTSPVPTTSTQMNWLYSITLSSNEK